MKKTLIVLSFLPLLGLAYNAHAFGDHHHGMQWWKNTDVISALQLSPAQINQLNTTYTNDKAQIKNLFPQLKNARSTLKSTIANPNSTMDDIKSASNGVLTIQQQISQARMNMHMDLLSQLSAQQRSQLVQFFQSHRKPVATPSP
jgi:Spy/CpxP family protein refolding chaperone